MALPRSLTVSALAAVLTFAVPSAADAAWMKPGKCKVPADQRDGFPSVDADSNRFSTKKIPCYIAAYAITDMVDRNLFSRTSFRLTTGGARWDIRLSCRSRQKKSSATPQPGRVITCKATKGSDGETNHRTVRSLKGGTLRWVTDYTG